MDEEVIKLFGLTYDSDLIYHLLKSEESGGGNMKIRGKIKTKEKCPNCKGQFDHIFKLGFICKKCNTQPRRFYVDLSCKGQRIKIYSDHRGHPLDSYSLALETLTRVNSEIRDGCFDPSKYIKKAQMEFYTKTRLDEYLERKLKDIAPSYVSTFKKHIKTAKEFFGIMDVREIRKIHLVNYSESLKGKGLSPKTVKNYLDTFRAFMNYLKNNLEIISEVPNFPSIEVPRPLFKWLSIEDQAKVFNAIPDEDKPIFAFLFLSGCRPAEARALKVKDVDLQNGTVTIRTTFSKNIERPHRKGKKSPSIVIPIHPELLPVLEQTIQGKTPEAYVFINPRAQRPYSQDALKRIWNNVRKKINLDKSFRLYDATRHSLASNLVNLNVPISKISRLLGHTNTRTTEKYAHVDIQSLRKDLEKVSIIKMPAREREGKKQVEREGK